METTNVRAEQARCADPDEINLLEYFYVLVKNKWLIIGVTFLGLIGGYAAALIKGPRYVADTVIAPREAESVNSPNVSGLGMFGGMVMSQMNIGGNASLDKVDLILDSRKFNEEVAGKMGLAPLIYPEQWDSASNRWIDDFEAPPDIAVGGFIKSELLKKEINKNNTMTLSVKHEDSLTAHTILTSYLRYLDAFIRDDVQKEAKENRDYLEHQLIVVTDPLLRTKIQELIAKEVEKMMVVSKEAFKIIDPVFTGKSFREKKLYPLVFAFGLFFLTVLIVVFKHAFVSGEKTADDKKLIDKIKKELFSIKPARG